MPVGPFSGRYFHFIITISIFLAFFLFPFNSAYSQQTQGKRPHAQIAQAAPRPAQQPAATRGETPDTNSSPIQVPKINFGITPSNSPEDISVALQIIILLTVLSLAPSILILTTAFTRIVIVLSFVRRALATQQLPSNQVLIGLSLILTFFVMTPTFARINEEGLKPYFEKKIGQMDAITKSSEILRDFMIKQTREADLSLFIKLAHGKKYEKKSDVPFHIVMPAFILSEMKVAFEMGLIIFLPFLVIDMVVASVLMSMGMMMLPPAMISLPFKILVFVLADGWHLIIKSLVSSFT